METSVPVRLRPRALIMIQPASVLIAKRFITSRHCKSFTRLTHLLAVFGIGLGVAILIVISSIFNGVEDTMRAKIRTIRTQIVARSYDMHWQDWEEVAAKLKNEKTIIDILPRLQMFAVIKSGQSLQPITVYGLPESYWPTWLEPRESTRHIPAWLHSSIGDSLYLDQGDSLSIITAKPVEDKIDPLAIRIEVAEIFQSANSIEPYQNTIFMPLSDLNHELKNPKNAISEIALTTRDILIAPKVSRYLQKKYPHLIFQDWSEHAQTFMASLQIQRKMMVIVLSLVTCIASFNLITGLVILVMDKNRDVAVLRTMGVSKRELFKIFLAQGLVIATLGALIGLFIGIPLAFYITDIVDLCERLFNIKLYSEQVFMLSYLPSRVAWQDCVIIIIFVEILACIAAIYPAREALKIDPANTLRHE